MPEMRSGSEALDLKCKKVAWPLQVEGEVLLPVEEFQYLCVPALTHGQPLGGLTGKQDSEYKSFLRRLLP